MHNHTRVSSPCSVLSPEEIIEIARQKGLDALCITEHQHIEGANYVQELGRKRGFPVFRGIEARTDLGDMLVFGYYEDIPEAVSLQDLSYQVHMAGGVIFVAHPFRQLGGLNFAATLKSMGLSLEADWDIIDARHDVDGIEIANGQVTDEVNGQAQLLAERWGMPGIGGSDSHAPHMVASSATRFTGDIRSDDDLVQALKSGQYEAVRLQKRG